MNANNFVRFFRFLADLSHQQLGEMVGREPSWIRRAERRLVRLTPARKLRFARALNVPGESVFPIESQYLVQANMSVASVPLSALLKYRMPGHLRAQLGLPIHTALVQRFARVTFVIYDQEQHVDKACAAALDAGTTEARAPEAIVAQYGALRVFFCLESRLKRTSIGVQRG
jgi:transcriptional regulator with XRE-family HTH domain